MPVLDQSVARQVGLVLSNILTPCSISLTMIPLDSSKSWVFVSSHSNDVPGLRRDLKGSIQSVMLNAYDTWLTSPNQERISVMLRGTGNSMMALRNRLHGCTLSDVIWKPANSTMS